MIEIRATVKLGGPVSVAYVRGIAKQLADAGTLPGCHELTSDTDGHGWAWLAFKTQHVHGHLEVFATGILTGMLLERGTDLR
jgi:hypothetical protein